MTREEKEQTGKYVLQMARLLEDGCYQQEMLLKAVHIIDEALEQEPTTKNDVVALDFSDDIDTPNKYQTADGKWHEGKILTTKNDSAVDCIVDVLGSYTDLDIPYKREIAENILTKLPSVIPQEPQTFKWCETCKEYDQEKHCCHRYSRIIRDTVAEIRQEPKIGHWIIKDDKEQGYDIAGVKTWYIEIMCSECGFIKTAIEGHTWQYHYCPRCGAKMVEPQESEDKE